MEALLVGGGVASGWIAAFVVALVAWRRGSAASDELADLRIERAGLRAAVEDLTHDYDRLADANRSLTMETEGLRDALKECEDARVAEVPPGRLGDLSSRGGVRRGDGDGGQTGTLPGPVPHWIIDPGDPDVSGG